MMLPDSSTARVSSMPHVAPNVFITSNPLSVSVDGVRRVLDRQDSGSYGKKEHKEANKRFQEMLKYYIKLLQILKKQQEDEAHIDEATIEMAQNKREEVGLLLRKLETQTSEPKWYSRFRKSARKEDFYGVDLEHLRILNDGLGTLIENLQSARKKKLYMRREVDILVGTKGLRSLSLGEPPVSLASIQFQPNEREMVLAKKTFRQLSVPFLPYWKRHEQCSRERLSGTCGWICETDAYQQWTGTSGNWGEQLQLLWLDGGAGTGKSILASYIVDTRRDEGKYVAYFYLGNGLVQTLPEVAVSLLTQLWTAAKPDDDAIKNLSGETAVERFDQWTHSCFQRFSRDFTPKPNIVFDGWDRDRMDDPDRFERFLNVLLNLGYYVLLTSRSKPQFSRISDNIRDLYSISLPTDGQRADLVTFSEQVIADHRNDPAYNIVALNKDTIIKSIIDDQIANSFHTARLYLESALRQTSEAEVHSILKETDPYRLIFQYSAGYHSRQISEASLLWLSQTKRPMKIDALREALALLESASIQNDDGDSSVPHHLPGNTTWTAFPETTQLPTTAFVRSCGMNLLRVDEASDTVALNHSLAMSHTPSPQSHQVSVLADMCILVLSIPELESFDYTNLNVVRDYTSKHQFLCYAASTFELHIEDQEYSEDMRPTLVQVLGDRSRLWKVIAIREWCKHDFDDVAVPVWQRHVKSIEETTSIQVAIECGDWKTLKELLDMLQRSSDKDTTDQKLIQDQTELESWCLLAYRRDRRSKCFDLLYEALLDSILRRKLLLPSYLIGSDYEFKLELSRPSDKKWTDVHKWFDKRHDITDYETNLSKLSSRVEAGDLLALRSAWNRAMDAKQRGAIVACALEAAVLNKDASMLDKLLRYGFDPSQRLTATERHDHSPLHAAAQVGSLDVVKLLIGADTDVEATNIAKETALFPAIEYARKTDCNADSILLIRTLLASGVDLNRPRQNRDLPTAMDLAISKGLAPVVDIFVQHGARFEHYLSILPSASPRSAHSSPAPSRMSMNESNPSLSEEVRDVLEKRLQTLERFRRNRPQRVSAS